jgi:hypothetical protein
MNDNSIYKFEIDLRFEDEKLTQIEQLIEEKERLLLENQKNLCVISKQNELLSEVKNDYERYNEYIIKQKEEQLKALYVLNVYMNYLENHKSTTKYNAEDMRQQQTQIMDEINIIKKNIDDIISNNR